MKLGSGVTMMEAAQCLGYFAAPLQLSKLVKHPNINKWSRCKPIEHNATSPRTVAELESLMDFNFWGFQTDKVGVLNTDEEMYNSALTLSQGECWHYSGVTATSATPAYLGDFRAYNSDAECPFNPVELAYYDPGVEGKKGPTIELRWTRNTNAEINPFKNTFLSGDDLASAKPGYIVYRKKGTTNAYSAATAPITSAFTSMTSGRIILDEPDAGDYETCVLVYNVAEPAMYPLPETHFEFSTRNRSQEEYAGLSLSNLCNFNKKTTATGELFVKMLVRNLKNEAITVTVSCYISDVRGQQGYLFSNTGTTFTIPANSQLYIYGDKTGGGIEQLITTDNGPIRIESLGDYTAPFTAEVRAKNNVIGDSTITKSKVIYEV